VKLSFHGAAQAVTGSCHLLEAGGLKLLVDCGLYQGRQDIIDENRAAFGFDPASVDCLLLTHAHLDHCGRIPLLVKQGFSGEIIATSATRELARLVLIDAAHLQEEDARHAERRARRRGAPAPDPLYTIADATWCFDRFGRSAGARRKRHIRVMASALAEIAIGPGSRGVSRLLAWVCNAAR